MNPIFFSNVSVGYSFGYTNFPVPTFMVYGYPFRFCWICWFPLHIFIVFKYQSGTEKCFNYKKYSVLQVSVYSICNFVRFRFQLFLVSSVLVFFFGFSYGFSSFRLKKCVKIFCFRFLFHFWFHFIFVKKFHVPSTRMCVFFFCW